MFPLLLPLPESEEDASPSSHSVSALSLEATTTFRQLALDTLFQISADSNTRVQLALTEDNKDNVSPPVQFPKAFSTIVEC